MIVALNFKAYKELMGNNALKVIRKIDKKFRKIKVIAIVNPADVSLVANLKRRYLKLYTSLNKYAETYGSFTGHIPLDYLKEVNFDGILLNHYENRISYEEISKFVNYSKKTRLETMVCVKDLKEAKVIDKLNPTYIAYEVPELIGSGKAISKYKAESLKEFVKIVKNIPICGAGISEAIDVKIAKDLGTKGVLIASAFAKSKDKLKFLKEIDKIL
ncbi:MAG: triose-phosphate isomerase [Candidatus Aenigmatarchaeota archaeon]